MSDAEATVERLRSLVSTLHTSPQVQNSKSDASALRRTLWDLHNQVPQNLEIFGIWQALNSAKRDPERFEKEVSRLVTFLQSYRPLKNPRPSQTGIVYGGEGSRGLKQNDPRADVIGGALFSPLDTAPPQLPDSQPLYLGPTHASYVEVQDMGNMHYLPPLSSQYVHYTPAQISLPEEHSAPPLGVPIEIVSPESGGHQPYDGLNQKGPSDSQQPANAASGNAMHSGYSAVPELMEPASLSKLPSDSETPATISDYVSPPTGQPLHATLLEPMSSSIHPSYYESAAHQRVSSTGIMTVTPVLRVATPVRRPDDGARHGTPASPSPRNYRSPSQHPPSSSLSSFVVDADRLPASNQQTEYASQLQAPLNGPPSSVSPNRRPEFRDIHNHTSPDTGYRMERPESPSAPQSVEFGPSSVGYEGSPPHAVPPSTNEYRSPTQRSAGMRPTLPVPPGPPSAVAPRPVGLVPARPQPNSATEPSAFHGIYAVARYSAPSHGDAGMLSLPSLRGLPKTPPAQQQETNLHSGHSDTVTEPGSEPSHPGTWSNPDSHPSHHHVITGPQSTPPSVSMSTPISPPTSGQPQHQGSYIPTPHNHYISVQPQGHSEVSWPSPQSQQPGSSNTSQAPAFHPGIYHPPSKNDEGRYNSSTSYDSTVTHDQKQMTSHNRVVSQGSWSSPQEPQPTTWNVPLPPGAQPGPPTHQPSTNSAGQYGSSSSYMPPTSYMDVGESHSPWSSFQGSHTVSNAMQPSGSLHVTRIAQPSTSNVNQYNSSSSPIPPATYNQNKIIAPHDQAQNTASQESHPDHPGVSQRLRAPPDSLVHRPSTSGADQYNSAPSNHVSPAAYSQTQNQSSGQASWSSRQPGSSGSRERSTNYSSQPSSSTGYNPPLPNTAQDSAFSAYHQPYHPSLASPTQNYRQGHSFAPPPTTQPNVSSYDEQYTEAQQGNVPARYSEVPSLPEHYGEARPPGQQPSGISQHTHYQRHGDQFYRGGQDAQHQMDQMNAMMLATSIGGYDLRSMGAGFPEPPSQSGAHSYSGKYDSQ